MRMRPGELNKLNLPQLPSDMTAAKLLDLLVAQDPATMALVTEDHMTLLECGVECTLYQLYRSPDRTASRVMRRRIHIYYRRDRYWGSLFWTEVTPSYVSPSRHQPALPTHHQIPVRRIQDIFLGDCSEVFTHETAKSCELDRTLTLTSVTHDNRRIMLDIEFDTAAELLHWLLGLVPIMTSNGRKMLSRPDSPNANSQSTASKTSAGQPQADNTNISPIPRAMTSPFASANSPLTALLQDNFSLDTSKASSICDAISEEPPSLLDKPAPSKRASMARRFSIKPTHRPSLLLDVAQHINPSAHGTVFISSTKSAVEEGANKSEAKTNDKGAESCVPVSLELVRKDILCGLSHELRPAVMDLLTSLRHDHELQMAAVKQDLRLQQALLNSTLSKVLARVQTDTAEKMRAISHLQEQLEKERRARKSLLNKLIEEQGNIRVFARVRPLLSHETNEVCVSTLVGEQAERAGIEEGEGMVSVCALDKARPGGQFVFDKVFTPESTQEEVSAEVLPFVQSCVDGYNVCIFAYGQTGSGKTFTMEGTRERPGVNYRALQELFAKTLENQAAQEAAGLRMTNYKIAISVIEIYNEMPRDLLYAGEDMATRKVDIRLAPNGEIVVPDLVSMEVKSVDDVRELLENRAYRNRAVGCTNMNEQSSRSHCALFVNITAENPETGATTRGKLVLVDLAGSERVEKSGAQGQAMKEAQNINKSLSALGDVIAALQAKEKHIPYRNSKLTFLLQDCLGGNAKCLMFCNVSPAMSNHNETLCSLRFAARARATQLGKAKKNAKTVVAPPQPAPQPSATSVPADSGNATAGSCNANFEAELKETQLRVQSLSVELAEALEAIRARDKKIAQLEQQGQLQQQQLTSSSSSVEERDALIRELQAKIDLQAKEIARLRSRPQPMLPAPTLKRSSSEAPEVTALADVDIKEAADAVAMAAEKIEELNLDDIGAENIEAAQQTVAREFAKVEKAFGSPGMLRPRTKVQPLTSEAFVTPAKAHVTRSVVKQSETPYYTPSAPRRPFSALPTPGSAVKRTPAANPPQSQGQARRPFSALGSPRVTAGPTATPRNPNGTRRVATGTVNNRLQVPRPVYAFGSTPARGAVMQARR